MPFAHLHTLVAFVNTYFISYLTYDTHTLTTSFSRSTFSFYFYFSSLVFVSTALPPILNLVQMSGTEKKNDVFCFLFLFYLVSLVLSFFLFSIHRFYGSLGTASRKLYLFFPLSPSSVFPFPSLTCFTLSYRVFVFYSPSSIPLGSYFSLSLSPFFSSFLLLFGSIYQLAYPPLLYSFSFIYHRLFWEIFVPSISITLFNLAQLFVSYPPSLHRVGLGGQV